MNFEETQRLIVNVRGCNSSGKTTLVRTFYNAGPRDEPLVVGHYAKGTSARQITATRVKVPGLVLPVWIFGPYAEKYGGCDKIQCEGEHLGQVIRHCVDTLTDGHLMYEGFRVSKAFNRSVEICKYVMRQTPARFVWASLLTDYDEIVRRVKARYADGEREPNYSELKSVVSAMKGQASKAAYLTNPSPLLRLNGNLPAEEVYQNLLNEMKRLETNA